MSSRLRSIALPAVALALALGALSGCGGDDEPAATAETEAAAPTEVDLRIASLVESRGEQLDLTATQFFGDANRLDDDGLRFVAPTRLRIAEGMEENAKEAGAALADLAPEASAAAEVAELGEAAFAALEKCARNAGAFWGAVVDGDIDTAAIRGADRTCEQARAAYTAAETAIQGLPEAPTKTTTGEEAAAGEEVRAVVHGLDPDDPQAQEVVQPVAPGAKVTIVFDAQNTSAFEWRLKENCDGPLTFDVSLLVNAEGTPAIDPAAAGYSGSGSPTKRDVEAKVTAQERFEIDVGTFTVPDGASGETQVTVLLAENRCPDPVTGTAYSPIAAGAESSGPLVLQAG